MFLSKLIWKPIENFDGYEVSSQGDIRSLNYRRTGKTKKLRLSADNHGYSTVVLCTNGKRNYFKVHRLVATAYVPNPQNKPQVNHKNEVKSDNRFENLEWATAKENTNYGTRNKKISKANQISLLGRSIPDEVREKMSIAAKARWARIKGLEND